MKKYIKIITLSVLVIAIFAASFFLGDSGEIKDTQNIVIDEIREEQPIVEEKTPPASETREENLTKEEQVPEITEPEKQETVSVIVECSDLLSNMEFLKEEKRSLVPENGIIFSKNEIAVQENESAFDILKRELINAGIHIEFSLSPVYNSAYIEGINNIYEFDCGERSGWKYYVNGKYPPVASSEYKVKPDDKIVFTYKRIAY